MAFLTPGSAGNGVPRAEINMIPLIDVMLVLLVIFMITAPLLTRAIRLDLPRASAPASRVVEKITVALDADGRMFWNSASVDWTQLNERLVALGRRDPATEIHLHADRGVRYGQLAEVMALAASARLTRIGFVVQPGAGNGSPPPRVSR